MEKCADTKYQNYLTWKKIDWEDFFEGTYKEKIKVGNYEYFHKLCEEERMVAPETFKVRYE